MTFPYISFYLKSTAKNESLVSTKTVRFIRADLSFQGKSAVDIFRQLYGSSLLESPDLLDFTSDGVQVSGFVSKQTFSTKVIVQSRLEKFNRVSITSTSSSIPDTLFNLSCSRD